MKRQLAFAILILTALMPVQAYAAKKKDAPETHAPAAGSYGLPSARLEPFLEPCLDAILAPLEQEPKMPRVEVEKLRSSFAGGQIKAKTPAQQQIYQNAMIVCDSLTRGMDDRAKAKSDALASAKMQSVTDGSGIIKSSPMRGVDAGVNAQAIRKKQQDERKYVDKLAHQQSAFIESVAYKAWTEKSARLRQSVMALYTRQIQLEALDEKNTAAAAAAQAAQAAQAAKLPPPVEKPAPPVQKPAPVVVKAAENKSSAKAVSYAGTWTSPRGNNTFVLKDDHTAIKMKGANDKVNGKWAIEENGDFNVKWEDHVHFEGKLSGDGQTLISNNGSRMNRQKP